jgi:excisionase family DNA binding protein
MDEIPEIKPEWISYRDAMKITSLSRGTLWRLAKDGFIPASKQGRAVRLHRESLDKVMWRGTEADASGVDPGESRYSPEDR